MSSVPTVPITPNEINQMAQHVVHLVEDVKVLTSSLNEATCLNQQLLQQNTLLVQEVINLQNQLQVKTAAHTFH